MADHRSGRAVRTSRDGVLAYVGLGSNLADPIIQVRTGMIALQELADTRVTRCSSLYRSAPVGIKEQPDFVNAVCGLRTRLRPEALLQGLLAIERRQGRERGGERGGPRTLDLDLLVYDQETRHTGDLILPHPRLHERAFVLYPLFEIDPEMVVPGRGRVADLIAACADQKVEKIDG